MKLKEIEDRVFTYSKTAGDISRQLSFAGIAIIWIFRKGGDGGHIQIEPDLYAPLICMVIALGVDLIQLVYQSGVWGIYYGFQRLRLHRQDEDLLNEPWILNVFSWIAWAGKIVAVIIGYVFLFQFLVGLISTAQ